MSKHTPGPWNIDRGLTTSGLIGPEFDDPVASVTGYYNSRGMTEANGRLIAAAPDLLSAAYLMDETAERFMEFDPDSRVGEAIAALRAAIAKATGEQP